MTQMPKALIDLHGEVGELDATFFAKAKRGRPALPAQARRQRVNLMLDADVAQQLRTTANMSALVNQLLRAHLGK